MAVTWLEVALTHQALGAVMSPEFTVSPLANRAVWGHGLSLIWERSKPRLCPDNMSPLSQQRVGLRSQTSILCTRGSPAPRRRVAPTREPVTMLASPGRGGGRGQGVTVW